MKKVLLNSCWFIGGVFVVWFIHVKYSVRNANITCVKGDNINSYDLPDGKNLDVLYDHFQWLNDLMRQSLNTENNYFDQSSLNRNSYQDNIEDRLEYFRLKGLILEWNASYGSYIFKSFNGNQDCANKFNNIFQGIKVANTTHPNNKDFIKHIEAGCKLRWYEGDTSYTIIDIKDYDLSAELFESFFKPQ